MDRQDASPKWARSPVENLKRSTLPPSERRAPSLYRLFPGGSRGEARPAYTLWAISEDARVEDRHGTQDARYDRGWYPARREVIRWQSYIVRAPRGTNSGGSSGGWKGGTSG